MFRVALFLYSFLYTIALLFYGPIRLLKSVIRNQKLAELERFGRLPATPQKGPDQTIIWIHAVSVGEVNATRPLVEFLAAEGFTLYLSTTTETGQELARSLFRDKARIFYFPLDWRSLCRKYLSHIDPVIVLLIETEIWPNFLTSAQDSKIPVILVNGRISDQSFRWYVRLRFFIGPLLRCFSHFCMQSEQDLERIREIGASEEQSTCTGNLKFDYNLDTRPEQNNLKRSIGELLKPRPEDLLLICGSTKPGEEEILLSIYQCLKQEFPALKLLLAPRHPHRGAEVAELAKSRGLDCLQRSQDSLSPNGGSVQVFILDSIGELASVYELGDLVFIGGSLVPEGGQNLIEAAAYGKPILFGPHMENFRQIAKSFVDTGAALQFPDPQRLTTAIRGLLQDPKKRKELGEKATAVIEANRGTTTRTVRIIRKYLPRRISSP